MGSHIDHKSPDNFSIFCCTQGKALHIKYKVITKVGECGDTKGAREEATGVRELQQEQRMQISFIFI